LPYVLIGGDDEKEEDMISVWFPGQLLKDTSQSPTKDAMNKAHFAE
jgi:hypothetical protein